MQPKNQQPAQQRAEPATPERTTRASYQQHLLDECRRWWEAYEKSIASDQLITFDWPAILYDFVKAIALESFKNGVTVGKRKAHANGRQQGDPRRTPDEHA